MKRIGFAALVALVATVPARADVYITAAQVGDRNEVIISFNARSEPNLGRPYTLDVRPDDDANIAEVTDTNECMKETHPAYGDWEAWGKPDCWCYRKQCRGDIDGKLFLGKPVTGADLIMFKFPFGLTDAELAMRPGYICADLNHAPFLGKRVTGADLIIFKTYFNQPDANVPDCDDTHYNFWIEP